MVGIAPRTRNQGLEEREQQLGARERVRLQKTESDDKEKKAIIDRINLNKVLYRQEREQKKEELVTEQQIGLPEMERREALQAELQARTDWAFRVSKRDNMARMGHEQERLNIAQKEYSFEPSEKEKDKRVLEAGIKPTEKNKDDLTRKLKRQKKKIRRKIKDGIALWRQASGPVFHSNMSDADKLKVLRALAAVIRKAATGKEILGKGQELPKEAQAKFAKNMIKDIKERKVLEEHLVKTRQLGRGI